jgi:hypothetical protein
MRGTGATYPWLPEGVELWSDPSEADWVVSGLLPWDKDVVRVGSYMVGGFERYARILHPAGGRGGQSSLRWAEVAARLSVPFHADVQFQQLAGEDLRHSALGNITPSAGSLPPELLRSLVTLLQGWTEESETCWFAMWTGNGSWWKGAHGGRSFDDERDSVLRQTPRVHTQSRAYFLMRGVLDDVEPLCGSAGGQSPALWWPQSRSWLVSTEVDAFSTYVGGSTSLIEGLLGSQEIEAVPSGVAAPLDWGL